MESRTDDFSRVPIHKRPGYQALNFAGGNVQSPAEAAEHHAARGQVHEQIYEGIDHDFNSVVARTVLEAPGTLGNLSPKQMLEDGTDFNVDPRSVRKLDPAQLPNANFSRGIHPNKDPMNPGPQEPSNEGSWEERSPQGSVHRAPGYGSAWTQNTAPWGVDNNMVRRPPLNPDEFGA